MDEPQADRERRTTTTPATAEVRSNTDPEKALDRQLTASEGRESRRLQVILGLITLVAAVIGAVAANADKIFGKTAEAGAPESNVCSERIKLDWAGTECPGHPAEVVVGTCEERRDLRWLAIEVQAVANGRDLGVTRDIEALLTDLKLVASPNHKFVYACSSATSDEECLRSPIRVGIGWSSSELRDGGIRFIRGADQTVAGPLYFTKGGWCRRAGDAFKLLRK